MMVMNLMNWIQSSSIGDSGVGGIEEPWSRVEVIESVDRKQVL